MLPKFGALTRPLLQWRKTYFGNAAEAVCRSRPPIGVILHKFGLSYSLTLSFSICLYIPVGVSI